MADPIIHFAGESINVPMGDIVRSLALAIAEAQFALDTASLRVAEMMSGHALARDLETGELVDADGRPTETPVPVDTRAYFGFDRRDDGSVMPRQVSMLELGFVPNFYQFVDTVVEVKLAMQVRRSRQNRTVVRATTVNGHYTNTYNFQGNLVSTLRTKLVPVPPPNLLEERIRAIMTEHADFATAEATEPETPSE